MFKVNLSSFRKDSENRPSFFSGNLLFIAGIILITIGVLIAAFPWLLKIMVSSLIIASGVVCISWGWRLRRIAKQTHGMFDSFFHRGDS